MKIPERTKVKILNMFAPNVNKLTVNRNIKGLIKAMGYNKHGLWTIRLEARDSLKLLFSVHMDENSMRLMKGAVNNVNEDVRSGAVEILGSMKDPKLFDLFVQALNDNSQSVRSAAVDALGLLKESKAGEPLIQLLRNEKDKSMRRSVKHALFQIPDLGMPEDIQPLIDALQDKGDHPREGMPDQWLVVDAIGKIADSRVVEPLIKVLKFGQWNAQRGSARVLGKIRDLRAVQPR
jgi:HEAT repeat protein